MSKFVIRRVSSGIKFDLRAANGQTIATSEVYTTEAACHNGIRSVRKNAPVAHVEDRTGNGSMMKNPKFELYEDKAGDFRFRLRARNGQIIAVSDADLAKKLDEKRDNDAKIVLEKDAGIMDRL